MSLCLSLFIVLNLVLMYLFNPGFLNQRTATRKRVVEDFQRVVEIFFPDIQNNVLMVQICEIL